MNTRINPPTLIHHPFPAFGSGALATLHAGGLVLLPTANLWQVVALATHAGAVHRLLDLCPASRANRPELIFTDTDQLRAWCPRMGPVLDNLLHYHRRPLTILVPAGPRVPRPLLDARGEVAVRMAMDSVCHRLGEDLEAPLVASLAVGPGAGELPTSFGKIRCDVLRGVNHTVRRRQLDHLGDAPTVMVRLNKHDEIEFVRS